ncbi:peptide ABC transporter substrate-binding protein [Agaribacterium haliotis]|uniref:peptide ABC transporter substrate-binding protein n=1 Tax=Agaribacterium haliotis TaxID=2013869 RepID=UPI001178303B|nr:peptide ABC transporter substrate-binding protein [Agaribacterium haliotis]
MITTIILCISLIACNPPDSATGNDANTLTLSVGTSPVSLDPHQISGMPARTILSQLFEPLVQLDGKSLEIVPAAAERWQVDDNGKRYVFYLRANARWSNGEAVTAQDFVNSWQRALHPQLAWYYASDFYTIVGAEDWHSGQSSDVDSLGVRAIDDRTLEFRLKQADPLFLRRLSAATTAPLHRASIEKYGAFFDPANPWSHKTSFVSNGPYALKKWQLNHSLRAVLNPHYWARDAYKIQQLVFLPIESEVAEERAFRSGKLQLVFSGSIPRDKIASYKKMPASPLRQQSTFATYYYDLNTKAAPLDSKLVRKALAFAIDRQAIVEKITKGGEKIALSLNPTIEGYSFRLVTPEYNLEKARVLLAQAGYPEGKGFPTLTLIYNSSETHRLIALAIQQMWREQLGISVELENQEWKVFLNNKRQHHFQISRSGSASDLADPLDFLASFASPHAMNYADFDNGDYDALLELAKESQDNERRLELLAQAESMLLDEMPLIPLYYYSDQYLVSPKLKKLTFNPLKQLELKGVYLEP